MTKLCIVVPKKLQPARNLLPGGGVINVPSLMELNDSQLLKACLQGTVYEVIAGRGPVLINAKIRANKNNTLPVCDTAPNPEKYYDALGSEKPVPENWRGINKNADTNTITAPVQQPVAEEEPKEEAVSTVDMTVEDVHEKEKAEEKVEPEEVAAPVAEEEPKEEAAPAVAEVNNEGTERAKNNSKHNGKRRG